MPDPLPPGAEVRTAIDRIRAASEKFRLGDECRSCGASTFNHWRCVARFLSGDVCHHLAAPVEQRKERTND